MFCRKQIHSSGEDGMIVVEATLSLTIFVVVVAAIIYLINIFVLSNKIQYSMNAAAHETAMYSYLFQVLGLREADKAVQDKYGQDAQNVADTVNQVADSAKKTKDIIGEFQDILGSVETAIGDVGNAVNNFGNGVSSVGNDFNTIKGDINGITEKVKSIENNAEGGYASYKKSIAMIKDRIKDPKSTFAGLAYLLVNAAEEKLKEFIGSSLASLLTESGFDTGDYGSADKFLKAYGVKDGFGGLDFSGSSVFKDKDFRLIDFVVEYDVDLGFAKMFLFKPTVHIVQRVTVPAWVNGDGYEVEKDENGKIKGVKDTKKN